MASNAYIELMLDITNEEKRELVSTFTSKYIFGKNLKQMALIYVKKTKKKAKGNTLRMELFSKFKNKELIDLFIKLSESRTNLANKFDESDLKQITWVIIHLVN